ncbi:MAG TPA: chemotaxis protein CheW, partial [Edaphobacter sp.]|nr:chemotaxis protein CheW [Edaphobacter sp.]
MMTNLKKSGINWEQARERLRASEHALAEALAENPARIEAAYRKRAAQLANSQARREPRTAAASALVFNLHQERYAIELSELAEVLPLGRCTRVPGAAPEFLGVISVRGELRPVIDLGRMILRVENGTAASSLVLMLRGPGREIGLKVDHVQGLREIPREKVGPPEQAKFTKRITGETLLLLDIESVLAAIFSGEES